MCRADEVDPPRHPCALNELVGDALLHRPPHVASVVGGAKLDVIVHGSQADEFILLRNTTQFRGKHFRNLQGFGFYLFREHQKTILGRRKGVDYVAPPRRCTRST